MIRKANIGAGRGVEAGSRHRSRSAARRGLRCDAALSNHLEAHPLDIAEPLRDPAQAQFEGE